MLKAGQFQIGSLVFGRGTMYQVGSIDVPGYGIQAGDLAVSLTDEIRHGRDFRSPSSVGITLSVLDNWQVWPTPVVSLSRAKVLAEALAGEWSGDEVRGKWGEIKPLIYSQDGLSERMLPGRPRKFSQGVQSRKSQAIPVAMDFQRVDTLSYANAETITTAKIGAPGAIARVGGTAPTWIRMQITGPIVNPVITFGSLFTVELTRTLAAGEIVEVNSYPWTRRVVNSGGLNLSPLLTGASAYLSDMKIPPSASIAVGLTGTGTNASTQAAVAYREAFYTF